MKTVLFVDGQRRTRRAIRELLSVRYAVQAVQSPIAAFKSLRKHTPDLVVVKTAAKDGVAIAVLKWLRRHNTQVPTVVLVGPGASGDVHLARELGASAVLRWPAPSTRLFEAVESADAAVSTSVAAPMITDYESRANLSKLEQRLNQQMKCFAGTNKVYIRSVVEAVGVTTKPRIALDCPLRTEYGLAPQVYYEYIRDWCCRKPEECPAVRIFRQRQIETA